jgi:glycosyltransferase involved in cell wall biosynthesis
VFRIAGLAFDQRREIGWRGLLARAVRRRPTPSPASDPMPPPGVHFDVIYAIGYWPGEPKRYRVFNMAEGLRAAGYTAHIMPFDRIDDICRQRWTASTLVLFRAEDDPLVGIREVLAYARATGTVVVYDIDDLLFDEGLVDRIDGLQRMGPFGRRRFIAAIRANRRLMLACDRVVVSTAPLARAAEALGKQVIVVPNGLNAEQLRLAEELAMHPRADDGILRIGYFSGSPTHQSDFAECDAALRDVLHRHPNARFRLVGYLDLGPFWLQYEGQIERMDFLPPAQLLRAIDETDINLASLEPGNPFCEAKSELKFFEAALVGVPPIASATEPFVAAIENGISGFIARGNNEWQSALDALVSSPERRAAMGAAARSRALERYAPTAITPRVIAALGLSPRP